MIGIELFYVYGPVKETNRTIRISGILGYRSVILGTAYKQE